VDIRETIKTLLGLKKLPEGEGLQGFTDEQLADAASKAREVFATAKTDKDVETATSAHSVVMAVTAEVGSRAEAAAKVESDLAALEAELPVEVSDPEPDPEPAPDPEPEPEEEPAPAEPEVTPAPEPVAIAAAPDPEPEPAPEAPKEKPKPVVPKPSAPPATKSLVRLTAAADASTDYSAGMPLPFNEVGQLFKDKAEHMRGGKPGDRGHILRAEVTYPTELSLDHNTPGDVNMEKINPIVAAAQEETARVLRRIRDSRDPEEITELAAAGGVCAPPTPRYEICQQGDDNRPLRDSLVRFGATRGGILTMSPPSLSDVDGAVSVITEAEDATGYVYPVDCIRVDCGSPTTTTVQKIPLCMEVGNFMNLAYPELFRAWWGYGQVAHARVAEVELWDGMCELSDSRTANAVGLGATRNTLTEIERYAAQLRYQFRIDPGTPLRLWYPDWLKSVLRADLTNQAPGDGTLAVSDAQLTRYFAASNIALTSVLDGQDPGSGDDPFPTTVNVILALEGTFLFLDMGRLDFGTEIRDFTQIRNNDVGAFMETFENVAAVCNGPQCIELPICATGTAAAADGSVVCAS
jgi:outer membrane biosynthesis protein TonB